MINLLQIYIVIGMPYLLLNRIFRPSAAQSTQYGQFFSTIIRLQVEVPHGVPLFVTSQLQTGAKYASFHILLYPAHTIR